MVLVPEAGVKGFPSLYGDKYPKHRITVQKESLWDFEGSKA